MRRIRAIAVFPTLFTLGNLVCGFFAIVVASRVEAPADLMGGPGDPTNCMYSAWLIFLAMFFDVVDGHVARWSRTTSSFGAQLDSLCDVVSFGIAPAFLLVKMCPRSAYFHRETLWAIAAAYAICATLRLARFNVETGKEDEHLYFTGLPSPAAAAAIASFGVMFHALRQTENPLPYAGTVDAAFQIVLPFYAVLVAALMVSRIRYPHVVNQAVHGRQTFGGLVLAIFALAALILARDYAVPLVCGIFVLYGPISLLWRRAFAPRQQEESVF